MTGNKRIESAYAAEREANRLYWIESKAFVLVMGGNHDDWQERRARLRLQRAQERLDDARFARRQATCGIGRAT
jgi:hypothetical protein